MTTNTPQATTSTWHLVWSDEFNQPDGTPIEPSRWTAETGGTGWGNGEWEFYTNRKENAYHQNGCLVIEARKEDYQGSHFTSARLITRGKGDWKYGRFEIRAKLPIGRAIWPAIWMMPSDNIYGNWPRSGEIDIMELVGNEPGTVYGTLHYGEPHEFKGDTYKLQSGMTFADDFHTFQLEWDPGEIRWYVDGTIFHKLMDWFTSSPGGEFPAPFDQPFHLILNVAVGGSWPGTPDDTTPTRAKMIIDYVRVYEKGK